MSRTLGSAYLLTHTRNVINITFTREPCPPAFPMLSLTVPLQGPIHRWDLPIRNPDDARLSRLVSNCAHLLGGEDARFFPVIGTVPTCGRVSLGPSSGLCCGLECHDHGGSHQRGYYRRNHEQRRQCRSGSRYQSNLGRSPGKKGNPDDSRSQEPGKCVWFGRDAAVTPFAEGQRCCQ